MSQSQEIECPGTLALCYNDSHFGDGNSQYVFCTLNHDLEAKDGAQIDSTNR